VHYRIGILGGSFDPIHQAHCKAAKIAREIAALDFIYLVPAGSPYHREPVEASSKQRLAMCTLASKEHDWLRVSRVDIDRIGNTYTIDTINQFAADFAEENPNDSVEWFLILGADAYHSFPRWKEPKAIAKKVSIIVVARPGGIHQELKEFPCDFIDVPGWEISSTDIRRKIRLNESIAQLVNANVNDYITTNKLYANQ
jgi:nicotinate-nucleotide adenylyltransferase